MQESSSVSRHARRNKDMTHELYIPYIWIEPNGFRYKLRQSSMLRKIGLGFNCNYDFDEFECDAFEGYEGHLDDNDDITLLVEEFLERYQPSYIRFEKDHDGCDCIVIGSRSPHCGSSFDLISYVFTTVGG